MFFITMFYCLWSNANIIPFYRSIYSFSKYVLPGDLWGSRDIIVNKAKSLSSWGFYSRENTEAGKYLPNEGCSACMQTVLGRLGLTAKPMFVTLGHTAFLNRFHIKGPGRPQGLLEVGNLCTHSNYCHLSFPTVLSPSSFSLSLPWPFKYNRVEFDPDRGTHGQRDCWE